MLRRTGRLRNVALLGVSLLISCAIGEAALRAFRPQPTYARLIELAGTYYAPSDDNTFQLKSGYRGHEPSMEDPGRNVTITTNAERFRGSEALDPDREKILVLGDSYTFGVYVNDDETYPAVLGHLLGAAGNRYQVINAGYTDGFETDQQYVWLKHHIAALRPRVVVLGIFLGNDITGIDPASWVGLDSNGLPDKWINTDLEVTTAGFLRSRKADPATVGTEAVYRLPVLRELHLAVLVGKAWNRLANRFAPRDPVIGESFDHIFGHYSEAFLAKEALFLRLLRAMKTLSQDNGSAFVVALLPMNVMVEQEKCDLSATYGISMLPERFCGAQSVYYARLGKLLQAMDIPAIDIEREMKQNARLGPFFPANGEVHFNATGHRFTAQRLSAWLTTPRDDHCTLCRSTDGFR